MVNLIWCNAELEIKYFLMVYLIWLNCCYSDDNNGIILLTWSYIMYDDQYHNYNYMVNYELIN